VTAERADIYVIRARLNAAGQVENLKETHTYGDGPETSGLTTEGIEEWLGSGGGPAGVELLVTVFDYDLKSLLGLPVLSAFSETISLRAHAVMRVGGGQEVTITPTEGCAVFPIALPASAAPLARAPAHQHSPSGRRPGLAGQQPGPSQGIQRGPGGTRRRRSLG
jgi:hypothetical protein